MARGLLPSGFLLSQVPTLPLFKLLELVGSGEENRDRNGQGKKSLAHVPLLVLSAS
jgi:hypothetical protein